MDITRRMSCENDECSENQWWWAASDIYNMSRVQFVLCFTFVGWVTARLGASATVSAGCNPSVCTSSEESKLHCCSHSPPIPLLSLDGSHQQWANPVNRHFRSAYKEPSVLKARKEINKKLAPFSHLLSSTLVSESPPLFCILTLVPRPKLPLLGPGRCCSLKLCHNDSTSFEKMFFLSALLVHNWNGCLIWFYHVCHHQNCSSHQQP